jgi:hypothetical protein
LPALTGTAALAASIVTYYPGWLSYDSSFQFWQVRTGEFSNLSPVTMTALWSVVHSIWPSPAAMLTLHLGAFWTGIVLLALHLWRHVVARMAFVLGVGFLPPAFVVLGHLWTDASLIAAMTLAFGLTVTGLVRRRLLPLALALPVVLYAGAVRHNSLLAVVPLCFLWAHACVLVRGSAWGRESTKLHRATIAGIAGIVVLTSFSAGRVLDHWLARERVSTWAIGALWDLAGISLNAGTLVIPEFARTPGTDLESLRAKYTPYVGVPLFDGPGRVRHGLGDESFSGDELAALRHAWLSAILAHPVSYVRHRMAVTTRLFGPYRGPLEGLFFVPTVVPYRDNPPPEAALSDIRDTLIEQVRRTRGWLIFTPAGYLAIAVGASVWGWFRRERLSGRIALALAWSGLLLVLPLIAFAPSAELRYCGWLFTSSIAALTACWAKLDIADG